MIVKVILPFFNGIINFKCTVRLLLPVCLYLSFGFSENASCLSVKEENV